MSHRTYDEDGVMIWNWLWSSVLLWLVVRDERIMAYLDDVKHSFGCIGKESVLSSSTFKQ